MSCVPWRKLCLPLGACTDVSAPATVVNPLQDRARIGHSPCEALPWQGSLLRHVHPFPNINHDPQTQVAVVNQLVREAPVSLLASSGLWTGSFKTASEIQSAIPTKPDS